MAKNDILEKLKGHTEVSSSEVQETLFNGMTREEALGRLRTDPATEPQKRMLFALGKQLGLDKDGIKDTYGIDSISELTIEGIHDVLEQMLEDVGEKKVVDLKDQTDKESKLKWQKNSGVNYVGPGFAKCGHCKNFTGENTLDSGKCALGIRKGTIEGKQVHPLTSDCFEFKHGPLETNIEVEPEEGFDPF